MAIRTKTGNTTIVQGNVDIEALAKAVARAVGKEIADELKEAMKNITVQSGGSRHNYLNNADDFEITIDESIIPVSIKQQTVATNLENMAKEEVSVDKDLKKSKSKLASLMQRKKK